MKSGYSAHTHTHTHWEIFTLLSGEWFRFDATDRLWYRDNAVSINLLLNAMKNPICVDDLQGTHLINNLVPLSSHTSSLSQLSHAIFVLLHHTPFICAAWGQLKLTSGEVESVNAIASLYFWQHMNTFIAWDSSYLKAHITWIDHRASLYLTTKKIRWARCVLLCS